MTRITIRVLVDLLVATITIAGLEKAIQEKRGNLAAVGRKFGVSRQYISKRVKNSAKLRKAWDEARETMLDNAETELYEQALGGNTSALIFYMKTQGKRRGYDVSVYVLGFCSVFHLRFTAGTLTFVYHIPAITDQRLCLFWGQNDVYAFCYL